MNFKKPNRKINRVFLHCSATDQPHHDDISAMRKWHTDPKPKGRGWSDVGYHLFIKKNGTIQEGRSLERTPASATGHNTGTIAICCHGLDKHKFTDSQFKSVQSLCNQINETYNGNVTFHGHCEVSNKSCPVYDYKSALGLDSNGKISGSYNATIPVEEIMPSYEVGSRTLNMLSSIGTDIVWLQGKFDILPDGLFGVSTHIAVVEFQGKHGLVTDGIVGKNTWKKLK